MKQPPPEMTVKAVSLGIFLAFVFGSANAYLGMKAGQTVAATIPAAVIAMALFRIPAFRGGILEQNITRTAASVGEALVAGAIFTIPAFMMVDIGGQRLWTDLRSHYWEATLILLVGGLIGVFFIILLRRPLCVDAPLPWPESVASYEIVKAGEASASKAPRYIFGALGFGGLIEILTDDKGAQIFREYIEGFLRFPRSVIQHFDLEKRPIGDVTHFGGVPWSTPSLSPALIGIGYIIGPELSSINVAGGIIAWWILIPLLLFFDPDLPRRIGTNDPAVAANSVWFNVVRPIAVGTMLVGAASTMFSMRESLWSSLRGIFTASATAAHEAKTLDPTERDIPPRWVVICTAVLLIPITAIYYYFTHGIVSRHSRGRGHDHHRISAFGDRRLSGGFGRQFQPAAFGIDAGCADHRGAGDADHRRHGTLGSGGGAGRGRRGLRGLLGFRIVDPGFEGRSFTRRNALENGSRRNHFGDSAGILFNGTDHRAAPGQSRYGWNRRPGIACAASGLDGATAKGIVGGQMAWGLLGIGAAFGIALLLCGARSPMLIAVGMYLPFSTTSAIFIGGLIKWILNRISERRSAEQKLLIEEKRHAAGFWVDCGRSHRRHSAGRGVSHRESSPSPHLAFIRRGEDGFR